MKSDPVRIQTWNLLIRSQMLYSIELRGQFVYQLCQSTSSILPIAIGMSYGAINIRVAKITEKLLWGKPIKNPPLRNQGWVLLKRKPTIISALGRKLLIDVFELSKIKQADNVKTDFENMIGWFWSYFLPTQRSIKQNLREPCLSAFVWFGFRQNFALVVTERWSLWLFY